LNQVFGFEVVVAKQINVPENSFNKGQNQYKAGEILGALKTQFTSGDEIKLGITELDLYAPGLNFVFGQAEPASGVAVISLFRLHDDNKFLKRVAKEAIHEIGHTLGLDHCPNINCVMHFSNSLHDTDIKGSAFCSRCRPKLFKLY
jgi:archaemetzincin